MNAAMNVSSSSAGVGVGGGVGGGGGGSSGGTITELRRIQAHYEGKIFALVDALDQYSLNRGSDYKESEQLARHAAKMCSRWKRLTSLTVEALVELDNEITTEQSETALLEESVREYRQELSGNIDSTAVASSSSSSSSSAAAPANKHTEEIAKLQHVLGLVQHFVQRAEQQQQQQQSQQQPQQPPMSYGQQQSPYQSMSMAYPQR